MHILVLIPLQILADGLRMEINAPKIDLKLHAQYHMMYTPEVKAKNSHRNLILVTCFNSTCKLKRLHLTSPSLHKSHTYCQSAVIGKLKNHKS